VRGRRASQTGQRLWQESLRAEENEGARSPRCAEQAGQRRFLATDAREASGLRDAASTRAPSVTAAIRPVRLVATETADRGADSRGEARRGQTRLPPRAGGRRGTVPEFLSCGHAPRKISRGELDWRPEQERMKAIAVPDWQKRQRAVATPKLLAAVAGPPESPPGETA
jgi:hypothetical protein